MEEDDPSTAKFKLFAELKEVERTAASVQKLGQNLTESARMSKDIAGCVRKILDETPRDMLFSTDALNHLAGTFRAYNSAGHDLLSQASTHRYGRVAQGIALATSTEITHFAFADKLDTESLQAARRQLHTILDRPDRLSKVRAALIHFNLNKQHAQKPSALNHLDTAHEALSRPSNENGAPIAVLLELRQAIETAVADLQLRLPKQERTGHPMKAKIACLGAQCGKAEVPQDFFARLGHDVATQLDTLSGTKTQVVERDRLMTVYSDALLLFEALLDSLDETKFRSAS